MTKQELEELAKDIFERIEIINALLDNISAAIERIEMNINNIK